MKITTKKVHTADVGRGFFNEYLNRNVKSVHFDMTDAEIEYTPWEEKRMQQIRKTLGKKMYDSNNHGANTINIEMNRNAFIEGLYEPQNITEGGAAVIHVYVGEFKDEETKQPVIWFRVNKIEPLDDVNEWKQYEGTSKPSKESGGATIDISDDDLPF